MLPGLFVYLYATILYYFAGFFPALSRKLKKVKLDVIFITIFYFLSTESYTNINLMLDLNKLNVQKLNFVH
jgi:hypothetical protein